MAQSSNFSKEFIAQQNKTDRAEPCSANLGIRIPISLKEKLKKREGWQEETRKFLSDLVSQP